MSQPPCYTLRGPSRSGTPTRKEVAGSCLDHDFRGSRTDPTSRTPGGTPRCQPPFPCRVGCTGRPHRHGRPSQGVRLEGDPTSSTPGPTRPPVSSSPGVPRIRSPGTFYSACVGTSGHSVRGVFPVRRTFRTHGTPSPQTRVIARQKSLVCTGVPRFRTDPPGPRSVSGRRTGSVSPCIPGCSAVSPVSARTPGARAAVGVGTIGTCTGVACIWVPTTNSPRHAGARPDPFRSHDSGCPVTPARRKRRTATRRSTKSHPRASSGRPHAVSSHRGVSSYSLGRTSCNLSKRWTVSVIFPE